MEKKICHVGKKREETEPSDNELKPSIFYLPTHTSSSTGAGGGGKVDLSTLRLFAFSLPLLVFAFFPITTRVQLTTREIKSLEFSYGKSTI